MEVVISWLIALPRLFVSKATNGVTMETERGEMGD